MELSTLLTPHQVVLNMKSEEHLQAIDELARRLVFLEMIDQEQFKIVEAGLFAREDQVSTGIGSGVAIPHVLTPAVDQVMAIFGRSEKGIDFEAHDNAPVRFVILLVVPEAESHLHLQTLAATAKLFSSCDMRQSLEEAETAGELIQVLKRCERKNGGCSGE